MAQLLLAPSRSIAQLLQPEALAPRRAVPGLRHVPVSPHALARSPARPAARLSVRPFARSPGCPAASSPSCPWPARQLTRSPGCASPCFPARLPARLSVRPFARSLVLRPARQPVRLSVCPPVLLAVPATRHPHWHPHPLSAPARPSVHSPVLLAVPGTRTGTRIQTDRFVVPRR